MRSTNIGFQNARKVLFVQEEGSVKKNFHIHQEFAYSLILWGQVVM